MVNTCVAVGCDSGYLSKKSDAKICMFHFPLKKPELLVHWERFVNRREWKPTENSVLCDKHFDEKYIKRFSKKCHLNWKMNPVPTIHSEELLQQSSCLPAPINIRKPPTKRVLQEDELQSFCDKDLLENFDVLNVQHSPEGFKCHKSEEAIVFYNLVFDEETQFPNILETIKVNRELHVQLQYNGDQIPLPPWFVRS